MKQTHGILLASLLAAGSASAATLSHVSNTQISGGSTGSDFTVSVFGGKAGYAGTGATFGTVSGAFGDGTVEAYSFYRNTLIPDTPGYGDNEIGSYASGGSSITVTSYNGATTFSNFDRADVWTTNDPDTQPANYGGTTETISGGHDVQGVIDISGYVSGTIYLLVGGYDNPFTNYLTLKGTGQTDVLANSGSIDPPADRNMYVSAFSFSNAADYQSVEFFYDFSGANNRGRFMGVVVDGVAVPEPSAFTLLGGFGALLLLRRRRA